MTETVKCSDCKGVIDVGSENVYCSTCAPGEDECSGCGRVLEYYFDRYCAECSTPGEDADEAKGAAFTFANALVEQSLTGSCVYCEGWPHLPTCVVVKAREYLDGLEEKKRKHGGIKITWNPCAR